MYTQTLYKILDDHIKPKVIKRLNRYKKWKYGYNEDHDVIVISKTGEIGEIYEIQNLKIALPKIPKQITTNNDLIITIYLVVYAVYVHLYLHYHGCNCNPC